MTSTHPLDRPVWNTLVSRQRSFAVGDRRARRFAGAFGLFAATADDSPECQAALAALVAEHGTVALVEAEPPPAIAGVVTEAHLIWQMVAERLTDGPPPPCAILSLTDADAPEMFALATLAKPGPFFTCTHRLGAFIGVRYEGALVAMAGERMKPDGFTEVSGVCTAPGHRGRGYGGALTRAIVGRVLARGETPFLHAYAHNTAAIGLYQTLGFALRREMHMRVLT
jgi:predicted GNAT family acetyltransferase